VASNSTTRTWTCACGKTHVAKPGKAIHCRGVGHSVTIMPAWFDAPQKTEIKIDKNQYALF